MFWLDNNSGVVTAPPIPAVISPTKLNFTEGGGGEQPSIPGAEWFNMVTDELLGVLTQAGVTPVKSSHTQLAQAIQTLARSESPVGAPIPWPLATPPTGFLMVQGQTFNPVTYPKLALAYPSGTLPDLRGEFIRGWDNGRGVDAGRALLSAQSDAIQNHGHGPVRLSELAAGGGTLSVVNGGADYSGDGALIGAISSANVGGGTPRIASETRPSNIAFNYIVRAA